MPKIILKKVLSNGTIQELVPKTGIRHFIGTNETGESILKIPNNNETSKYLTIRYNEAEQKWEFTNIPKADFLEMGQLANKTHYHKISNVLFSQEILRGNFQNSSIDRYMMNAPTSTTPGTLNETVYAFFMGEGGQQHQVSKLTAINGETYTWTILGVATWEVEPNMLVGFPEGTLVFNSYTKELYHVVPDMNYEPDQDFFGHFELHEGVVYDMKLYEALDRKVPLNEFSKIPFDLFTHIEVKSMRFVGNTGVISTIEETPTSLEDMFSEDVNEEKRTIHKGIFKIVENDGWIGWPSAPPEEADGYLMMLEFGTNKVFVKQGDFIIYLKYEFLDNHYIFIFGHIKNDFPKANIERKGVVMLTDNDPQKRSDLSTSSTERGKRVIDSKTLFDVMRDFHLTYDPQKIYLKKVTQAIYDGANEKLDITFTDAMDPLWREFPTSPELKAIILNDAFWSVELQEHGGDWESIYNEFKTHGDLIVWKYDNGVENQYFEMVKKETGDIIFEIIE